MEGAKPGETLGMRVVLSEQESSFMKKLRLILYIYTGNSLGNQDLEMILANMESQKFEIF